MKTEFSLHKLSFIHHYELFVHKLSSAGSFSTLKASKMEMLGPSGKIKRNEFLRIILQTLRSLGYWKTASCLESESGVSYKSKEFNVLEALIKDENLDASLNFLNSLRDMYGEAIEPALFRVLRQRLIEYLKRGEINLASDCLRKWASSLQLNVDSYKIRNLAADTILLPNDKDGDNAHNVGESLMEDLENLLPPPISIPTGRLQHLVERAVLDRANSCLYHTLLDATSLSLFQDHHCGKDHFPTTTTQILTEHQDVVWFVKFSHNGEYLASASIGCTAIWKVQEDGKLTPKHTLRHEIDVFPVRWSWSFVAWSPDDTKLLTCGNAEFLKLWDVETGTCTGIFGDYEFVVTSCAWFPNSIEFVGGSDDPVLGGMCMWNCDGNIIKEWRENGNKPRVRDLAITPDGKYLIRILILMDPEMDPEIRILNWETNAERVISEAVHPYTCLSVSEDSKFFLFNMINLAIHLWDVDSEIIDTVKYVGHKQPKNMDVPRSCFGGLDSTFIASGSGDSQVYIWNRRSCEPIEVLSGHSQSVNSVSWNPKRPTMLASASDDHTVRIWGPSI